MFLDQRNASNKTFHFPFDSLHIQVAHKFRCQKGCHNVGFSCERKRKAHHESVKHWPDSPLFGRPPGIECYRCGRCGKARPHRENHRRHINTCKGGNLDKPVSYECARHGPTDFDKEKHLAHLKDCLKKTPGKTQCRVRATESSVPVPINALPLLLTAGTPECHAGVSDGMTPGTWGAMTLERTPEVGFSIVSSAEATALQVPLPGADPGVIPVPPDWTP